MSLLAGFGTAEVQVSPALHAPVVDLKMGARLPAARADPPGAPELTVTITPSEPKLTSMTDAPGSPSSRFNAVLTRTSSSFASRRSSSNQQLAEIRGRLRVPQRPRNSREGPDPAKSQQACDERGFSGRHFTPQNGEESP